MSSCKDMTKLISDSLDQKLSLRKRLELRLHIVLCGMCRRFRSNMIVLRKRVRESQSELDQASIVPVRIPTATKNRLEEVIKRHLG